MKIVALNGSPRGEKGYTHRMIELFAEGVRDAGSEMITVNLAHKKIHHCTGEFACWFTTPGSCIHRDDMDEILPLVEAAEGIVFATPVYVDGMTGLMKNCVDRMVAIAQPFMELKDGHMRHLRKTALSQKIAIVSVCGFNEADNFDPLVSHVKAICKNMNAEYAGAVLRPGAPSLDQAKLFHPIKHHRIKSAVIEAGREFAAKGTISPETEAAISQELFATEQYMDNANKQFHKIIKR